MAELANCIDCNNVFVKSMREICQSCFEKEEQDFKKVYHFLMKRKNREATMADIVRETEVKEEKITKFVKEKRLLPSSFPMLTYPCERCGKGIKDGMICANCAESIHKDLVGYEELEKIQADHKAQTEGRKGVYYSYDINSR